jgi:hypothetical protein
MTATVEFSDDARRMLDDADERWVAEHGYFAANRWLKRPSTRPNCSATIQS